MVDERSDRKRLQLIGVVIAVVTAVITGWRLHQFRLELWQTQARASFREVVAEEMQKKSKMDTYYATSGDVNLSEDTIYSAEEPVKVEMLSGYGRKEFLISGERFRNNPGKTSQLRGIHSYLLHLAPLSADSLHIVWQQRLVRLGFPGETGVCVSVTDWWERETSTFSADSLHWSRTDSLAACYLGYRCEVGVTGYMRCPWWEIFTVGDKLLLCALVLVLILLFGFQDSIIRFCHRLFVREVPVVAERKVPVPVEKEVPVIVVPCRQTKNYQLSDGLFFDGTFLYRHGGGSVKLAALSARLLQGFLEADDNRLSNDEILNLLWPDDTGTPDKLHTNIKRLRGYLSQITDWTIENKNRGYSLKSPISSHKNPHEDSCDTI